MNPQTPAPEGTDEPPAHGTNAITPELQALIDMIQKDPAKTAEEIKSLRAEAKQRRLDAEAADRERLKAEAAKLEADQEWQKAATTYKTQLEALSPLAEQLAAMKETIAATVHARIEQIPKDKRGLVPEYDDPAKTLAWLERNASVLVLPAVPNLNNGDQGDRGKQPIVLTPEQKAVAKRLNMSEEKYATELRKEQAKRS